MLCGCSRNLFQLRSCRTNDKKLFRFTLEVREVSPCFLFTVATGFSCRRNVILDLHLSSPRRMRMETAVVLAPPSVAATGTPGAEADVGERLFVETRFAQAFKVYLDSGGNVNDALPAGDPVMDLSETTGPGVGLHWTLCRAYDELPSLPPCRRICRYARGRNADLCRFRSTEPRTQP